MPRRYYFLSPMLFFVLITLIIAAFAAATLLRAIAARDTRHLLTLLIFDAYAYDAITLLIADV